jgi:hypothetical protein
MVRQHSFRKKTARIGLDQWSSPLPASRFKRVTLSRGAALSGLRCCTSSGWATSPISPPGSNRARKPGLADLSGRLWTQVCAAGCQRTDKSRTVRVTLPNGRSSIRWRSASGACSRGKDRSWAGVIWPLAISGRTAAYACACSSAEAANSENPLEHGQRPARPAGAGARRHAAAHSDQRPRRPLWCPRLADHPVLGRGRHRGPRHPAGAAAGDGRERAHPHHRSEGPVLSAVARHPLGVE